MIAHPLQDYITIRSDSGVSSVTQNESGWADLAGFQDIVAFLDVKEFSGATTILIAYQTSPTRGDESLWVNMTSLVTLATGLTTTKMLKATATVPVARFVRWQLSATTISGAWGAYFRVWLACNRAGKRNSIPLVADTWNRMMPSEPSIPLTRRSSNGGAPSITYRPPTTNIVGSGSGSGSGSGDPSRPGFVAGSGTAAGSGSGSGTPGAYP